jgi:hypothetical protein
MRRFPVGPLLDRIVGTYKPLQGREAGVVAYAALRLGVGREAIYRWRHTGLDEGRADKWAFAAGFHPSEVWTDWFHDIETVA